MCDYCKKEDLNDVQGYCKKALKEIAKDEDGIEINIYAHELAGYSLEVVGVGSFDYDADVPISYCPMCGRKL